MTRPGHFNHRVLDAAGRTLGKEHPLTVNSLNNLAGLYFMQRNWTRAAEFWRRSTAAISARGAQYQLDG